MRIDLPGEPATPAAEAPAAKIRPSSADAIEGDGFEPVIDYMVQQQRHARAAQAVAEASRLALARERVSEEDLRRADEQLRDEREAGAAAPDDARPAAGGRHPRPDFEAPDMNIRNRRGPALHSPGGLRERQQPLQQVQPAPQPPAPDLRAGLPAGAATAPGKTLQGDSAGSGLLPAGTVPVSGSAVPGSVIPVSSAVRPRPEVQLASLAPDLEAARAGGASVHPQVESGAPARVAGRGFGSRPAAGQPASTAAGSAVSDVLQILHASRTPGRSVIRLQLSPPELGRLTVDVTLERESITVRIAAESEVVRDVLQSSAGLLAEALQDLGLNVEQMIIELQEPADAAVRADGGDRSGPNFEDDGSGSEAAAQAADPSGDGAESMLAAELPAFLLMPGWVDIKA